MTTPPPSIGSFKRTVYTEHGLAGSREARMLQDSLKCDAPTAVGIIVQLRDLAVKEDKDGKITVGDAEIYKAVGFTQCNATQLGMALLESKIVELASTGDYRIPTNAWKKLNPPRSGQDAPFPKQFLEHKAFMAEWDRFIVRRKKQGSFTALSERRARRKLIDYTPAVARAALIESNTKDYTSVFPHKHGSKATAGHLIETPDEETIAQIVR